jgi:hypothetical protein
MAIKPQAQASQFGLKLGDNQRPTSIVNPFSNLQALVKSGQLLDSSQDLILGRKYGYGGFTGFASPSQLDLNGATPKKYTDNLPK